MKKIALLLSIFACALTSHAYDEAGVEPVTIEAGKAAVVSVYLNNTSMASGSSAVQTFTFDIVWPEGWTVSAPTLVEDRVATYDEDFEEYGPSNFSIANQKNGNVTRYIANSSNLTPLNGTSGAVFTVKVKAPAGTPDGYYPVVFLAGSTETGSYITNKNGSKENIYFPDMTSYIKVGNPENATFAVTGQLTSVLNEALATETGISTLDLTKATASNGTFTYVDGRAVKAPEAAVKGKVAYKRSVSGLASVCLPFAADLKAYTYSNMAGEYAIFDEVSALEANTPAIVDANIDITVEDATIGSVEAQTITKGYYLKGGKFYSVNGSAVVAPLRGYWELGAGVKGFKFNDADAIMTVDANANEDIFNLNGVKLNKAQRGVNIIGGKKVMK